MFSSSLPLFFPLLLSFLPLSLLPFFSFLFLSLLLSFFLFFSLSFPFFLPFLLFLLQRYKPKIITLFSVPIMLQEENRRAALENGRAHDTNERAGLDDRANLDERTTNLAKSCSSTTTKPMSKSFKKKATTCVSHVVDCDDTFGMVLSFCDISDLLSFKFFNKRWKSLCNTSIDHNFKPKKVFENGRELRDAVHEYCSFIEDFDKVCSIYGYPINKWQVGKVQDFSKVFHRECFNEYIGDWDTSNATSFCCMFDGAVTFNQDLSKWDTSKVTNMSKMFRSAVCFNQPLDSWDTSNVTNMQSMFESAADFNQPLESWDMHNVRNTSSMFKKAGSFNQRAGRRFEMGVFPGGWGEVDGRL